MIIYILQSFICDFIKFYIDLKQGFFLDYIDIKKQKEGLKFFKFYR